MKRFKTDVMLQICEGSIVDCYTDAVVIPTSKAFEWEPEVKRELTKKAGQSVVSAACRKAPLDIGEAVVTPGGGMLACFIIHVALPGMTELDAVSPQQRHELLEMAVRNCVLRCAELAVPSIGLPNLGRWLGFPAAESARLMLAALDRNVPEEGAVNEIHLILSDTAEATAFADALGEVRL